MVEIYFALMIFVILMISVGVVKFYRALKKMERLSSRFKALVEIEFVKKNTTTFKGPIVNLQIT